MELYKIAEKIKEIVRVKHKSAKVKDSDVASELGIAPTTFASMKSRNSIPFREISEFCAKNRISINWLLFDQSPESLIESTNKYFFLKYYKDINVSAGGGAINWDDECEEIAIESALFEKLDIKGKDKSIEAINITGDSMEPTFNDDDVIFVDRERRDIARGGIFVLATEGGLFVKRLQTRVDGRVDVISDNKEYPVQTLSRAEIEIIGKVVGRFGRI